MRRIWQSAARWNVELAWWLTELAEPADLRPNAEEVESFHWLLPEQLRRLAGLLDSNQSFLDAWQAGEFTLPGVAWEC